MTKDERVAQQIGFALRRIREERGTQQYMVADLAGITKGMLSSYETGKQTPQMTTLVKVLQALNCSAEDFGRRRTHQWCGDTKYERAVRPPDAGGIRFRHDTLSEVISQA